MRRRERPPEDDATAYPSRARPPAGLLHLFEAAEPSSQRRRRRRRCERADQNGLWHSTVSRPLHLPRRPFAAQPYVPRSFPLRKTLFRPSLTLRSGPFCHTSQRLSRSSSQPTTSSSRRATRRRPGQLAVGSSSAPSGGRARCCGRGRRTEERREQDRNGAAGLGRVESTARRGINATAQSLCCRVCEGVSSVDPGASG
jgi:hypothetical protein